MFDFGGNKLSFHKKSKDTWRIVTDLSKEEAETLWHTKPLGQYSGSKMVKAWFDLKYPLYDTPPMTYQFEVNSTIVKDQIFMRFFLKQQQRELFDKIYPVKYGKKS